MYSGNRSIFTRVEVPSARRFTLSRPGNGRYSAATGMCCRDATHSAIVREARLIGSVM